MCWHRPFNFYKVEGKVLLSLSFGGRGIISLSLKCPNECVWPSLLLLCVRCSVCNALFMARSSHTQQPAELRGWVGRVRGECELSTSRCYEQNTHTDKLNYFLSAFIEAEWSPKYAMNLFFPQLDQKSTGLLTLQSSFICMKVAMCVRTNSLANM